MRRMGLLAALAVTLACCGDGEAGPPAPTVTPSEAESWQQTVDDLRDLQKSQQTPDHLWQTGIRDGTEFDVQEYFTILDHLSVEAGWVLDYGYQAGGDRGYPILYARPADDPPYATYQEYQLAVAADPDREPIAPHLHRVVVDGTPEGFFQYVVLEIMGGQFYLHWHAGENDSQIITTQARLQEIIDAVASEMGPEAASQARGTDPTPQVSIQDEVVVVQVSVFTRWGGLLRRTYTISREFPHRILGVEVGVVAECDCGIPF